MDQQWIHFRVSSHLYVVYVDSEVVKAAKKMKKKGYTITETCLFNILKISPPKTENLQIKNSDIFHISAQNIDCGYSTFYVFKQI